MSQKLAGIASFCPSLAPGAPEFAILTQTLPKRGRDLAT